MGNLDLIIKDVNKKFGNIAYHGVPQKYFTDEEKIPFSSIRLNYMLYGGINQGRLVEFCGEENSGKTTTALDIVANAQKFFKKIYDKELENIEFYKESKWVKEHEIYLKNRGEKKILWVDCENTLDEDWAKLLGVDINNWIVIKPQTQTAEQIFQMIEDMVNTDELGLVVIDSLAVMVSKQAYEKTIEEKTYGGISAALTLFSERMTGSCSKYKCTLIGINQVRDNMGSPYGGKVTPGGKGWKHNCSIRLEFQKGAYIDENRKELKRNADEPFGNLVMTHLIKTKVCKPNRKLGFYTLTYTEGIDVISDMVDLAIKEDLIIQSGSWFNIVDPETGGMMEDDKGEPLKIQGKPNVISFMKENKEICDLINKQLYSIIGE